MTQAISFRPDLAAPPDDVREAVVNALCLAQPQLAAKASVIARIEGGGQLAQATGLLGHVMTEILLDAAAAFPENETAEGNVVVVTCTRIAGYAAIRVSDNAPDVPRRALCLAAVVERIGGELRLETAPTGGCTVTVMMPLAPPAS